jgi:heme/copper-type cytochrome/quinol oxidase subunit 1
MLDLIASVVLIIIGFILVFVSRQIQIEDLVNKIIYVIGVIILIIGFIFLIVNLIYMVV